jgi:ATP-dependent Clp protease ATP-binding subunit ClpA
MFERFTKAARQVVLNAVVEAEREQAPKITPEHLLLALLHEGTRSAPVLTTAGLTKEVVRKEFATAHRRGGLSETEAEALAELGIDLAAVVARVEATHGENALAPTSRRRSRHPLGHTPFTSQAKSILVNALRQAQEHNDRHVADEHFLLALAATPGLPAQILATHNLTYPHLRTHLAKAS